MLTFDHDKAVPEVKFNAVEPSFAATDFNEGHYQGQPVEGGTEIIVRLATFGPDRPSGSIDDLTVNWLGRST
jgi:hypothetical protein